MQKHRNNFCYIIVTRWRQMSSWVFVIIDWFLIVGTPPAHLHCIELLNVVYFVFALEKM